MANVRIQSSKTITVTKGLQHVDVTNADAHVPDRLKVSPSWQKSSILIRQGVGLYPAEIKEWNTVKALAKDGILTIGDTINDQTEAVSESIKTETVKSIKRGKSLDEISE